MGRPAGGGILRRPSPSEVARRGGLRQFFGEVVNELKKVTWPTRQETVRLTVLVIAVSASIGIALGIIDLLFTRLFDLLLF